MRVNGAAGRDVPRAMLLVMENDPHPEFPIMTLPSVTPSEVRTALLLREEIALLDVRHEAAFATGHPLFAANMAADRIALEAETRLPRKDVPIVLYDAGEGLVAAGGGSARRRWATAMFASSTAGCRAGKQAGYELFQDVNSYAKAFGELVEHRRHTPSLAAEEVAALIASRRQHRRSSMSAGSTNTRP